MHVFEIRESAWENWRPELQTMEREKERVRRGMMLEPKNPNAINYQIIINEGDDKKTRSFFALALSFSLTHTFDMHACTHILHHIYILPAIHAYWNNKWHNTQSAHTHLQEHRTDGRTSMMIMWIMSMVGFSDGGKTHFLTYAHSLNTMPANTRQFAVPLLLLLLFLVYRIAEKTVKANE